ncbi:MAG: SRPBCC family protein [candidate division NC10 bacterium]
MTAASPVGRLFFWLICSVFLASIASAGSIDTSLLEQAWPKQRVKEYEIDKYPVRWRQAVKGKGEEIFAGASFTAPAAHETVWNMAADYTDLGTMTPGVERVQFLEDTPTRQVIQIDMKVLWKTLRLAFEIEREPPTVARFRMASDLVGEYRGFCRMRPEGGQTQVELATWLRPAVRVPAGLILWVERAVMLKGIRGFLEACERAAPPATGTPSAT